MKVASLPGSTRDGMLVVVSSDLSRCVPASPVASTLQQALDRWSEAEPGLRGLAAALERGTAPGVAPFDPSAALAPLPRAHQWLDASAFLAHGRLMARAMRLAANPQVSDAPLMYQGGSDDFLGPCADAVFVSEADGIDCEGEFGVILDEVAMGATPSEAERSVKLIVQLNDWSLRALAPREMQTGFGFIQSKPATAFAPVAVTPDELGPAWRNGRVELDLHVDVRAQPLGRPNGREMGYSFFELIAHAARTRRLRQGAIVGSGTVSNQRPEEVGSACIAERRGLEMIQGGEPITPFLRFGDQVRMEALAGDGQSVFGAIDQRVARAPA
jgi:fumarylacetoacetate (FAA) hydrolase